MKNTYYVVVGILVLVIGYLFYKKMQEQKANEADPENGSITTPNTSVDGVTPVQQLPTATPVYNPAGLKNGDSVTVLSNKNLRKTDKPYAVSRKTTAQEKGWKVHGRVYVNTIDKITGSWCVIKKEIVTFGAVPFLQSASYANTTVYHVVAVTSIIKA